MKRMATPGIGCSPAPTLVCWRSHCSFGCRGWALGMQQRHLRAQQHTDFEGSDDLA